MGQPLPDVRLNLSHEQVQPGWRYLNGIPAVGVRSLRRYLVVAPNHRWRGVEEGVALVESASTSTGAAAQRSRSNHT